MDFIYYYKTSEGERREAEISAPSRDEAFAALRKHGVRPIRMIAKRPAAANYAKPAAIAAAICLPVAFAVAAILALTGPEPDSRPGASSADGAPQTAEPAPPAPPESAAAASFRESAGALAAQIAAATKRADMSAIARIGDISSPPDRTIIEKDAESALVMADLLKRQARALFEDVETRLARDGDGPVNEAKKTYGDLMGRIDALEERAMSAQAILMMLDENPGRWRYDPQRGKAVFDTPALQDEYDEFLDALSPETARWQRDFARRGVESEIVSLQDALEKKSGASAEGRAAPGGGKR